MYLFYFSRRIDQDNQYYEYTLIIYNTTFEDETDIKINAKSSALEKWKIIKPNVTGNPVGQLSFISNETSNIIPWRDEDYKTTLNIYSYGIYEGESYTIGCTVRHRSDIQQPLNVFIQYLQCPIDNCLSDIIDKSCRSTAAQRLSITPGKRINNYQTLFVSSQSQILVDPAIGHQYICCYEHNGLSILAKGLTALARMKETFFRNKLNFIFF